MQGLRCKSLRTVSRCPKSPASAITRNRPNTSLKVPCGRVSPPNTPCLVPSIQRVCSEVCHVGKRPLFSKRFPKQTPSLQRQRQCPHQPETTQPPELHAAVPHSRCTLALTLSPSATSQIFSPVHGSMVGNVLPLTESFHSLLMKICKQIQLPNLKNTPFYRRGVKSSRVCRSGMTRERGSALLYMRLQQTQL